LNLIHDTELVACTNKETLSELIETSLEHGALRAGTGTTSMPLVQSVLRIVPSTVTLCVHTHTVGVIACNLAIEGIFPAAAETIVTSAAWDGIGAPLSAIRCNVGLCWNLDVSVGTIVKMD